MNLLELRTQVRKLLNEPTPTFWTDEELTSWLNLSQLDIVGKVVDDLLIPLTEVREIIVPEGFVNGGYPLPQNFLRTKVIWTVDRVLIDGFGVRITRVCKLISPKEFQRIQFNEFLRPAGYSKYCYIWKKRFFFVPLPDEITIWYIKYPKRLIHNTDVPDFPEILHMLLCYYTLSLGYTKDHEFEKATYWKNIYETEIAALNTKYIHSSGIEVPYKE